MTNTKVRFARRMMGGLAVLSLLFTLGACTSKPKKDPKSAEIEKRVLDLMAKEVALEEEIKNTIQDEGKQTLLRSQLELLKSRILRTKEEWKQLNHQELVIELPKKEEGGH